MPAKIPTLEAILSQLSVIAATSPLDLASFYDWREGMARPFIEAKRPRAMGAFDSITALVPPSQPTEPGARVHLAIGAADAAHEGLHRAQIARINKFLLGLSG